MARAQASNYRILASALALKSFSVNDLARFSTCLPGTVRTTLNRNRDYIEALGTESSGKRGGQPSRYRLIPQKEAELKDWLKKALPQLQEALPSPEVVTNMRLTREPGLGAFRLASSPEFPQDTEMRGFSTTLAHSFGSLSPGEMGDQEPTLFNQIAPSGMLVAAEQLGERFETAKDPEQRRELLDQASDSLRAGRAEYESWPSSKKQSPLGVRVAVELKNLHEKLQLQTAEIELPTSESVATVDRVHDYEEQMRTLEREFGTMRARLRGIEKAQRFYGGTAPSGSQILIDSLVESDFAFPDGDIEITSTGDVHANISARNVKVRGRIQGSIVASGEVSLLAGCRLVGDITASRISIEDGAFFKGGIDIRRTIPSRMWTFANQSDAIEAASAAILEREPAAQTSAVVLYEGLRLSSH